MAEWMEKTEKVGVCDVFVCTYIQYTGPELHSCGPASVSIVVQFYFSSCNKNWTNMDTKTGPHECILQLGKYKHEGE